MCEDCDKRNVCKHYHGLLEMTGLKREFKDGMEAAFRDVLREIGAFGEFEGYMDKLREIRQTYHNSLEELLFDACEC